MMYNWNKYRIDRLKHLYSTNTPLTIIRQDLRCNFIELREKIAELGLVREKVRK